MKSGTDSKTKFKLLQRRLRLALWQCRGLLDTLWDSTRTNAPDGNLGRFTPEEIAIAIDWQDDPDALIDALVGTKWLDRKGDMLLVHDWPEHCEDSVHKYLARRGLYFADGTMPNLSRLDAKEREKALALYAVRPDVSGQSSDVSGANGSVSRPPDVSGDDQANAESRTETHGGRTADNPRTPAGCPNHALPVPVPLPSSSSSSPPPPDVSGDAQANSPAEWRRMKTELRKVLNDAAAAIRDAQANGMTVAEVRAIVEHWQSMPGAWPPGALHHRIRTGTPGLAVGEGWVPVEKAYARDQATKAGTERQRRDSEKRQQQDSADKAELERLEREHGAELDALPQTDVEAMCGAGNPIRNLLKKAGRSSVLVREFLLRKLDDRKHAEAGK